jgi:hypothetical protein
MKRIVRYNRQWPTQVQVRLDVEFFENVAHTSDNNTRNASILCVPVRVFYA